MTYRVLKVIPPSHLKQINKQKLTIDPSISRKDSISSTQVTKPKTCKYISNLFLSTKLVSSLPPLSLHFQQARPAEMSLPIFPTEPESKTLYIHLVTQYVK